MDTKNFNEASAKQYKQNTVAHWKDAPCGFNYSNYEFLSRPYFDEIEYHRYSTHPWILEQIHQFALQGKKVLEIGFGMGTDHLALARQGGIMYGLDLTAGNSKITRTRFDVYGFSSQLLIGDGEKLPYAEEIFDLVYSFGVPHHTPDTAAFVDEVMRVLKPGGQCYLTVYHKNSLFFWWSVFFVDWLLKGGFRKETLKERLSRIEYPNQDTNLVIKLFKKSEFRSFFHSFRKVNVWVDHLQPGDISYVGKFIPKLILKKLSGLLGWYVIVNAEK